VSELLNPEKDWVQAKAVSIVSRAEVEKRLGPTPDHLRLLPGSRNNRNIQVGEDRVLRLYPQDESLAVKEEALLRRPWKHLAVPPVLASGPGYLVMGYVPHQALEDDRATGEKVGRALAEIHSYAYAQAGFLDGVLAIEEPMDDFVDEMWGFLCSFEEKPKAVLSEELLDEVLGFFDERIDGLKDVVGKSVLLHGDFKIANLHRGTGEQLLVLDWEMAYAGSALVDLGSLFRWEPSPQFELGFIEAYQKGGGVLVPDWRSWARLMDLVSLVGLLYGSPVGSKKALDVTEKIRSIIRTT